ncbi:MAG: DUF5131 family protein [Pyrinomonadaceae bacterium]
MGISIPRGAKPDAIKGADAHAGGISFFFKQWGEWMPVEPDWWSDGPNDRDWIGKGLITMGSHGQTVHEGNKFEWLKKVGKKKAGRLLDGREWNEFPKLEVSA